MADAQDPPSALSGDRPRNPLAELWEQWAAMAAQLTPSAAAQPAEQLRLLTTAMATFAEVTSQPLEDFLTAQRRFAETVENWAEMQKVVADQAIELARQQRMVVDALDRWSAPLRAGGRAPTREAR